MYFNKLNALRGIGCCLVVIYHSPMFFSGQPSAFITSSFPVLDFFFILSGFVMCHTYGNRIATGMSFSKYFFPRLARVYPMHFVMLLVWVLYVFAKQYMYVEGYGGSDQFSYNNRSSFFANLYLTHSMGTTHGLTWNWPSWTVSAEVFAYVVFFLFTATVDRDQKFGIPIILSVLGFTFIFSLGIDRYPDLHTEFGFIQCVAGFYAGVFLYRVRNHLLPRKPLSRSLVIVLELAVVFILALCWTKSANGIPNLIVTIMCLAGLVLVCSTSESGFIGRMLEWRIFQAVGDWSLSIYLTHAIIIGFMVNIAEYGLGIDFERAFGFYVIPFDTLLLGVTIGVSALTFQHVEQRYRGVYKRAVQSPGQ